MSVSSRRPSGVVCGGCGSGRRWRQLSPPYEIGECRCGFTGRPVAGVRTNVVDIEAARPVWMVCLFKCGLCGHTTCTVVHEERVHALECPACSEFAGVAIPDDYCDVAACLDRASPERPWCDDEQPSKHKPDGSLKRPDNDGDGEHVAEWKWTPYGDPHPGGRWVKLYPDGHKASVYKDGSGGLDEPRKFHRFSRGKQASSQTREEIDAEWKRRQQ